MNRRRIDLLFHCLPPLVTDTTLAGPRSVAYALDGSTNG